MTVWEGERRTARGIMDTLSHSSERGKLKKQVLEFKNKLTVQRFQNIFTIGTCHVFKL